MELILSGNNTYRNGEVAVFKDNEGLLVREPLSFEGRTKDQYHVVKKNDRLDLLAWNFYKKTVQDASKFWWIIADANEIENPLDISDLVGKSILIPNILDVLLKLQE